MIKFTCSFCRKEIVGEDSWSGQQGECPFCRKLITAPGKKQDAAQPVVTDGGIQDVPRCPKCGARRQEMKQSCGFCGAALDRIEEQTKTRRVDAKTRRKEAVQGGGLDKRKVVLLGALLAAGLIVVVLIFAGGGDPASKLSPVEQCQSRLTQLSWTLQDCLLVKDGVPPDRGSQFWIAITKAAPGRLRCPAGSAQSRVSDYRGPSKSFDELAPDGVLAACQSGSHPEGTPVLLKSFEVHLAPAGSDLHKRAMAETQD